MKKGAGWLVAVAVGLAFVGCLSNNKRSAPTQSSYRSYYAPSSNQSTYSPSSTYRQPTYSPQPSVAENGSYYGEISKNTGRPKTVKVRGYYRKDGTYVRGHYRSKPRR